VFLESRHYRGVGGDVEFDLQFHGTLIVSRTGLMKLYTTACALDVGQVANLRGGWLPPPVGRLPIGRSLPSCPTRPDLPLSVPARFFINLAGEGPLQQTSRRTGRTAG
jgi:hypothetical protein